MSVSSGRVHRVVRRTHVPIDVVRKVLEANETEVYAFGTVARAYFGANMAIYTPNGWKSIPNTDFLTEQKIDFDPVGWEIVYDPDNFRHQTASGKGDGAGELVK